MHYTRFLACMFKHEEETIFILVSNQSYSTDLQEIIIDTFILKNDIKGTAEKLKNELFSNPCSNRCKMVNDFS